MISIEQATLEVVAEFPKGYFLENLAVRAHRPQRRTSWRALPRM